MTTVVSPKDWVIIDSKRGYLKIVQAGDGVLALKRIGTLSLRDLVGRKYHTEYLLDGGVKESGEARRDLDKSAEKKDVKYSKTFSLVRPTPSSLLTLHRRKSPSRLSGLSHEALAFLSYSSLGHKTLVLDDCKNLVVAALVYTASADVTVLSDETGSVREIKLLEMMGLPRFVTNACIRAAAPTPAPDAPLFSLVIFTGNRDFLSLLAVHGEALAPGGKLVAFHSMKESLLPLLAHLLGSKSFTNVKLREFFSREYQLCPGRTHPHTAKEGHSGFVLEALHIKRGAMAPPFS